MLCQLKQQASPSIQDRLAVVPKIDKLKRSKTGAVQKKGSQVGRTTKGNTNALNPHRKPFQSH